MKREASKTSLEALMSSLFPHAIVIEEKTTLYHSGPTNYLCLQVPSQQKSWTLHLLSMCEGGSHVQPDGC